MTLATLGRCNSQLKASSNRSWPLASQKSARRSTMAQLRSVSRRSAARGVVVNRASGGIGDMLLVEFDVIGVEPLQARLDGRHDVAPGSALPSPFPVHRPGKFAGEHDLVPPPGEGTAELSLRPAALAIGVGGVEKGDAEIESLVHDGARRRIIDAPAEIIAAEPNRRDDQPGTTEIALLHRGMPYPVTIGRHYRQKQRPRMQQIAAVGIDGAA